MALVAGIKHLRDGIEPQAVLGEDMSTIGVIGTAPFADASVFPLNTPVYLTTSDSTKRAALGSSGTLVDAATGVSAQLANTGAARMVVVRVDHDADPAAVIANIIGNEANRTGMWALLDAPEQLAVTPRLLIVPGYTSQTVQGLGDVTVTGAGSGGTDGTFPLAFTGGTGSGGAGTFTVTGGAVTSVTLTARGEYSEAPTLDFSASANLTGETITVALEQVANGVCANMPTICERLKAVFLPEGPTNTRTAAVNWLETLPRSGRILHPLRQDAKVLDGDGNSVTKPLSPYIMGCYVARDAGTDGVPTRSAANQSIYGITGVTPVIPFSFIDESVEGQSDIALSFGIVAKGDLGVSGAISDGGFVFWGTDTLSSASEWLFANVNRMRDYLELMQVKALRYYLGRFNLTSQTVQAIINTLESELIKLKADQYILDFRLGFDADVNTPENLRLGYIDLQFQAEEPPVLRKITLRSRRHREALEALANNIAIQINTDVA
jgi:phage tail sheath protein FI